MSAVTPEVVQIEREVREAGGEAEERLRAKCRWEAMTRYAVIREWGDPRRWADEIAGRTRSGLPQREEGTR